MKPRRLLSRTRKPFAVIFIVGFFLFVSLALKSIFAALAASPEAGVSVVAVAPRAAALQAVNTLLELRFENGSLNGAQGETPTQSSGITAQAGINGQGLYMDRGNRLTYPSELNINSTEGTIELWMKPSWNGNDGQNHAILRYGLSGSYMFLGKEGNNLRLALNRASDNGSLELDVFTNIQNWQADQWHHVAAVWSNAGQFLRLYVDGMLASERSISATLPTISSVLNPTLQIGGDSVRSPLLATIDNVLISDGVRSAQEIATHMLEGLTISAVTISPSITSLDLYSGWTYWQDFKYTVTTPVGSLTLPWLVGSVNSSAAGTATTDSISGRIKAGATTGTATITANFSGLQTVITVNVLTPKKAMETDVIDTYLSTPRTGALYKIPVAIIRYLPAKNATDLDDAITGFASTLAAQRTKQIDVEKKLKFMLEEGSRFRGYKTSGATASLGYQVVKIINVYEDVPPGLPTGTTGVYFPDYKQIFSRHNVKDLIMNQGVKEIWFEQYVNGRLALDESNLASSLTGDISKSLRTNDDLPVYSKSYTLFGINIAQAENNAARSHGHHLEALLTYANMLQDGDDTLFQEQFIGRAVDGSFAQGRVGKTDRPPNSASDFDFNNTTEVDSDMQDWFPDGHGTHELISRDAWANLVYSWPVTPTGKTEGQWYLFWMQLHPGLNNGITRLETERLTNWWRFTADWDAAMQVKLGLVEPLSCQYALSSTSRNVSGNGVSASVNVTCGANCKWTATTNETWIKLTTATGTGNGAVNFTVDPTSVARTGTIVIADQLFTINQSNCTFTLTPATQNIPATSGTATLAVTVAGAASCPWTATSDSAWLTVATGGSGTGNGTITFNVAANTSVARTATVTVADQTVTITQNSGCVFTLVPTSRTVSALGGTDSLNVQTGTGCPWTAISNDSWLQITAGSSGTGNGTVSLTIAANSGPQRNGTLNVSGQTYTVTQTAANPLPTLTGLNPTSINAGNAAFNLTVTGTNFVNTSVVNWNGSLRVTTFVNATQLTAAITAADVAATGTASVTVTSPAPGGGTTGALNFAINNPAPTLTSISPTSTTAGGAGLTLTLNGTNFNAASVAQVNGSNRTTTFVSGTQLTISLTSSDVANAGTLTVVVVNPAPGGGTSGQQTFTINNPAPTLTSLSQNTVTAGNGAFTLTVNGTNFVSGSKVRWNGADRTTTFVSSTQLSASITAADVAAAGTGNVTVFNAAPGGGTSSALSLTITAPCSYALTASNQNFTTAGGAGGVTLNTGAGCAWTVTNVPTWVTLSGASSGSGTSTINFTVATNTGAARNVALSIAGQTFTITQDAAAATCSAQRTLPAGYFPSQAATISVQATPGAGAQSYALEETPPTGWTIANIDNGGVFDAVNGKVKWGPFFDANARTLSYTATPPANTTGAKTFSGTISINGVSSATCGNTSLSQGSLSHPADLNDNFRLDINELTAYGSAWKAGTAWSRAPNPIDINYLTNAGLIWKTGEVYHYDGTKAPPFAAGASVSYWLPSNAAPERAERVATAFEPRPAQAFFSAASYLPAGGLLAAFAEAMEEVAASEESVPFAAENAPEESVEMEAFTLAEPWTPAALAGGTAVGSFSAANYSPSVGVTVTITVTPDAGTQVYAIEETPPLNWSITSINNGGAFDAVNKKVKWGPFFDNTPRTLTYIATPPAGESGSKTFVGSASFDGSSVAVTGSRALSSLTCSYTLGSSSQSFNANASGGSFGINAPAGCTWNATTGAGWISFTQGSGSGNGSVNFSVSSNSGAVRSATITVGGQSFTVNQAANIAPTITPAAALTRQQSAAANAVTIATISDTETAVGSLTIATTAVPTGLSVTTLTNTGGTVSAVVTAGCGATLGANTIGLQVTDAHGATAQASLTVNVTSSPSCFLQVNDTTASAPRVGSVLLYGYYTSSISTPATQNTQLRITNTHETQDTAVRLYFVDGQAGSVASLFVCLPPNQTASFLMSEVDPGITGYVIAVAVNKTTGCPINFNSLLGGASVKLSSGHTANLSAIAITALATTPATCANNASTLNFDGTNYARLPRMLLTDSLPSLKDNNDTRLILARIGGSLVGGANGLGAITGKIYNSSRTAQDFTFSGAAPQFSSSLSVTFPRLTTRLDLFIPTGQSGWLRLWTDANIGILGTIINQPANLRTTGGFASGYNLPQGALSAAVSLEIPVSVPSCQ